MRVIQTRNDTIRLIFNPKTDGLCLSDFLIVRDGKDNFLAQIVEIYDDKFNQEENVASIKLIYRILPDYQVVPYDNFTPSRECEIAKIKPEEIEKCLNMDKVTVPFGISTKNNRIVNVNLDFFNNNPVIFADKLDEVNCAFENIAQKLKAHKKVIAIDYTGNLNIKNAKRVIAHSDFKLPLDYYSLDYIWEKALKEASPEVDSELEDMFIELKKFVDSTEDKYIPFPRFIKVIEQQYKATPAPELHLLLTRLKRYSNDGLFSRSKKEFQAISKALQKENVLIIDFSKLKLEWHKEFLEFVVRQIRDYDAYLLLRLNENNSNPELINNLYVNNPKLNIIPSISYGFVKMPQVMEFARNYILYKTLNPRRDFGFANFQIAALNASTFLIFGKDTMDFMFTMKNYIFDEEDAQKIEDKKIYIDLNLELEEMTSVELAEGNFDLKNIHIQSNQKRLADEVAIDDILPGYEQNQKERLNETNNKEIFEEDDENSFVDDEAQNADASYNDEAEATEEVIETDTVPEEKLEEETASIEEDRANITEEVIEQELSKEEKTSEGVEENKADSTSIEEKEAKDKENTSKEELSVVADDAKVAELIEASLKNDEEYIKEISENKEENEIPLKEDELDYFVNPDSVINSKEEELEVNVEKAQADEKDEIITSEMINDAIDNENLAKEIEEQAQSSFKKNLEADKADKEVSLEDNAVEVSENIEKENINPVAIEPEMIKQAQNEIKADTEAAAVSAEINENSPEEKFIKEEASQNEDNLRTNEKETLESLKEEAHSVLEKESVQKVLDAVEAPINTSKSNTDNLDEIKNETEHSNLPAKNAENTSMTPVDTKPELPASIEKDLENKPISKKDAIIIVKEKPNLLIDDFTQDADLNETKTPEANKEENESLKELAQKSIETRFDEVIGETKKPEKKRNKLKINDNVSIDIDAIKNKNNSTQSSLPIFNNNDDDEEDAQEYNFIEGMKVSHEKYGNGSILRVVKYSNRCLLQIEFEETGKRLLDPKIAKIKPV